jgi:predicted permease
VETLLRIGSSIVPVFLILGLGALLARRLEYHLPTLNRLSLYALSPCLVFDVIAKQDRGSGLLWVTLSAIVVSFLCLGLGRVVARAVRADRPVSASVQGTSAFLNAGAMGLPITLFAFGEEGLARAAAYMVGMAVVIHTVGVVVYSMGREPHLARSLLAVLKVPLIYAVALALLLPRLGIELPDVLSRPISMLGQAAIPVLLLSLGIQLGTMGLRAPRLPAWGAVAVRLLLAPLAGFALALGLRAAGLFGPLDLQVFTLMCGLPPAAYNFLLSERFGGDVEVASESILWGTALSFLTVALLLGLLGPPAHA